MKRRLGILLLLLAVVAVPATAADYSISPWSPTDSTDVPTRTVTVEGQEFDISTVGRVSKGTDIAVRVTAPDSATYDVLLYDSEENKLAARENNDGETIVTFPSDPLDPGTYGVVVSDSDSRTRAVQPVVVSGYDIALDGPSLLEAGTEGQFNVSVTPTASDGAPAGVELAFANSSWDKRVEAERVAGSEYRASVSLPSSGEYQVYAAALGSNTAYGEREALALTASSSVSVTEPTTTTETTATTTEETTPTTTASTTSTTPEETTSTTATTEATVTTSPTATTTTTAATTATTTPATTTTATPTTTGTETTTTATTTTDWTTTASPTATTRTTTTNSVITPNPTNRTNTPTESDGTPGFTAALTLGALALAAALALRGDSF